MTPILIFKLCLVPFLIWMVTLAGRRWGPAVAGWLSAFPVVAGPILLAIAFEQGPGFAASAAEGTLLAVVAILIFSIVYAWMARRAGVVGSMACALLAWALAVAGLQTINMPLAAGFALVWAALLVAPRLIPVLQPTEADADTLRRRSREGGNPISPAEPIPVLSRAFRCAWEWDSRLRGNDVVRAADARPNDLPWRMLAGAALVLSVTFAASHIGARLSGFFAMFPVMSTVLVGFSHVYSGPAFAVALLRGMVAGYFAFSVFCVVVSLLLRQESIGLAFCAALACALAVQLATKRLLAGARANPALAPDKT